MKKFILLLFISFLPFVEVDAQTPNLGSDIVITIKPTKPKQPINPFSLNVSDISAYYRNDTLVFVFNEDLGEADIVVTNLTTGDAWSESVEGLCTTSIILSDDAGYYTITIHTDAGDYYGEFSL